MDKILKNKLNNIEISVPDDVWTGIEKRLDANYSAKRSFIIYKFAAAIAALAIIGSSVFYFFMKGEVIQTPSEIISENITQNNTIEQNILVVEKPHEIQKEQTVAQTKKINGNQVNEAYIKSKKNIQKLAEHNPQFEVEDEEKNEIITDYPEYEKMNPLILALTISKKELNIITTENKNALPDLILVSDEELVYAVNTVSKVSENNRKWVIGGEFSPLYSYRYITETQNGKDADYYNELERPILTYSGGVNVQYNAFKRLTVQTGIYYSSIGQSIGYVGVYENNIYDMVPAEYQDRYISSYNIENSTGSIEFSSKYIFVDNKSSRVYNLSQDKGFVDVDNPIYNDLNANIEQNLKYIEVPVFLRYKLIDKIIDVNIMGGIGANFLLENNVYINYSGVKEDIGHTKGVNRINYSGSIGIGVDYPMSKQLFFRLEPTFKYYINPISNNSAVESHPYTMGLFTGIYYSF